MVTDYRELRADTEGLRNSCVIKLMKLIQCLFLSKLKLIFCVSNCLALQVFGLPVILDALQQCGMDIVDNEELTLKRHSLVGSVTMVIGKANLYSQLYGEIRISRGQTLRP